MKNSKAYFRTDLPIALGKEGNHQLQFLYYLQSVSLYLLTDFWILLLLLLLLL